MSGHHIVVDRIDDTGVCPLDAELMGCTEPATGNQGLNVDRIRAGACIQIAARSRAENRPQKLVEGEPEPNVLEASPAEGGDELQYTTGPEERIGAGAGTIDRKLVIGYCGGAAAVPYCTVPARWQGIAGELGPSRRG